MLSNNFLQILQSHSIHFVFTKEQPEGTFLVPTFQIGANPQISLSEIKARRFYIVDRAQINAKRSIQQTEDEEILRNIYFNGK